MPKDLIKISLTFIFLSGLLVGCAQAQTVDLSTDEAVIIELQKIIDAKNAKRANDDEKLLAKQKAAGKLEAKDVRIERIKETEIIVIGFFRTDVGFHLDGIFVGSRYFDREEFDLSKIALAALGWKKASEKERETLAKIWVERGLLVFAPLSNQTLSAVSIGDGKLKITASSKYPPGVTSRSVSKVFDFNQEGGLESADGYR